MWASLGDSLVALRHPDGKIERLGTPQQRFLGWPMGRDELVAAVDTGIARLWPRGWLLLATGLTEFLHDWREAAVAAAIVRTHYPHLDFRRGVAIPPAATVVRQLIDAAYAGGAGDTVSLVVLGRETFTKMPRDQGTEAFAAWVAAGGRDFRSRGDRAARSESPFARSSDNGRAA